MYLLVGLPHEKNINITEELRNLKNAEKVQTTQIELPKFTNLSLSNCSSYDDKLNKSEKECLQLIKIFRNINKNFMLKIEKIKWDSEKYQITDLNECISIISKDTEVLKNLYYTKKDNYNKIKKELEILKRKTGGNLSEVELGFVYKNAEEYEFLENVYILIDKENLEKFNLFINNSKDGSLDACEEILKDEKFLIFKLLILKNFVKDFETECTRNGFVLKEYKDINIEEVINRMRDIVEEMNHFDIFINSHIEELYKIFVHIKLLKLFLDSFYRFGLPKEYAFFVCQGDKALFKQLKKLCDNWKSDRLVEESEENDDQLQTCYAYTMIDFDEAE